VKTKIKFCKRESDSVATPHGVGWSIESARQGLSNQLDFMRPCRSRLAGSNRAPWSRIASTPSFTLGARILVIDEQNRVPPLPTPPSPDCTVIR
jgi:hypothetical protein